MKQLFGRAPKRRWARVITTFLVVSAAITIGDGAVLAGDGPAPVFKGLKNEQQLRVEQQREFRQTHSDASGHFRPTLISKGIAEAQQLRVSAAWRGSAHVSAKALANPSLPSPASAVTGAQWTQYGPQPLRINAEQNFQGQGPDSGEVTDVAIDPRGSTDQVMYRTENDGGVWKTSDGGTTWAPMTDFMPTLSMGAVTLDAGNPSIVYAGTGNLFNNGFFNGIGIYRSTDAGQTWTNLGKNVLGGKGINRMVSPAPNVLLVGTQDPGFTSGGLYRSVDGGTSYGNNSPTFNNGQPVLGGFITDLRLDTTAANAILAAVYGVGIFRSTDGGATWGPNLFTAANGAPTANYNYISFAQSTTPDDQTIYASVAGGTACPSGSTPTGCNYNNLYVSTDGGANWTAQGTGGGSAFAAATACQCGYDQTIGVDPNDASKVYLGFQKLWYSSGGGAGPFNAVSDPDRIHWDHHALTFSPATHATPGPETRVWVGEDGGMAKSDNAGTNWDLSINESLSTNLFRGIDIGRGSTTNNVYAYGGNQDTGTVGHRPGDAGTDWHLGIDGDGGKVAVDWCDPQHVIGSDDGGYSQTTNGGNNWSGGGGFPANTSLNVPAFDPRCADRAPGNRIAYFGGSTNLGGGPPPNVATRLFVSNDNGSSYTIMKTFGTAASPPGPAGITTIATSPLDANVLWVGFNDGTIQKTSNALMGASATWTPVTVTGAAALPVGYIALDPTNNKVAVVTYEGFSSLNPLTNRTKHIFRTTDDGATWTDVSGVVGGSSSNYPDLPTHSVVIDPGTAPHSIIVSNDAGVFRSLDNGLSWQKLGVGLPTVDSTELALDYGASPPVLRVGTYGRSTFQLTAPTGPVLAVNTDLGFGNVGLGERASRVVQVFNVGTTDLHISGFSRLSGDLDFTIFPTPPTPVTIQPGEELDFTIQFQPTQRGNRSAIFHIQSDDPSQPDYQLAASGTGVTGKIAVSGSLEFGTVARGTAATRALTVQNTGLAPLTISAVSLTGGSDSAFSVLTNPGTPQTIQPSDSVVYTVRFAPPATSNATLRSGTLRVSSDDPDFPNVDLPATGIPGVPKTVLASNAFDFGGVPVDNRTTPHVGDRVLRITNEASCVLCDLTVNSLPITGANFGDFSVVSGPATPFSIGAGNHVDLTIRFNPPVGGARNATLTVNSDDPANPSLAVSLTGEGLLPAIASAPGTPTSPLIFGPTVYDPNCGILCGQTQTESFTNTGQAELIADLVTFTGSPAFSGPGPSSPPDRFAQGTSLFEPVTFHPTAVARKVTGMLTVTDSLPLDSTTVTRSVPLCGEAVGRGIRVLVEDNAGNPITTPIGLQLRSVGTSPNVIINVSSVLQTISPPTSCQTIRFDYENQKLPATEEGHASSSYYTLVASVGSTRKAAVTFTLAPNEFRQIVMVVDTDPPTIFAPTVVSASTRSAKGMHVKYRVRAVDKRDGRVAVNCRPASGSFFRIGTTRVTCRAHDRAGNKAVRRFKVVVRHRR
jgi:hypothetical protein